MLGTVSTTGELKTAGYIGIIEMLTGSAPVVKRAPEYNEISFTATQKRKLQELIEKQLSRDPGEVRVNVESVIQPVVLKRMVPYLAAVSLAGFITGRLMRRKA